MEKEPFNDLLANVTSLTVDEANQLVVLANTYPYSQVIRNLAARAAQDNGLKSKEKLLQNSAIYSTDRSALKALMTAPTRARVEVKNIRAVEDVPTATTDIKPVEYKPDEQLHERLMADLAAMHESKKAFEDMIEKIESKKATPLADVAKKKEKTESKPAPTATPGDLIEEIKTTKKKIKPETDRQIEQNEIIDQFIKAQPSISKPNRPTTPKEDNDLAEPSGQLTENVVSETLVEILLKQGKKEKAIEALRKLIWKFPQKKAYFAAQIEDLRK